MTKQTVQLTNMFPGIKNFQDQLQAKYATANKNAELGQIDFVGSSTMEIFPIDQLVRDQNRQLDHKIYNRGVRATTTADVLANLDTLVFDLKPSKLFINIGSNDIGFNVPEAEFLANYTEILHQVKAKLPDTKIYVMAFFPINDVDDFGEEKHEHGKLYEYRSNQRLADANNKVAQLAAENDAQFINLNDGLTDGNGNLRKELTFDGAHMLPAGYQIVLENMMEYLQ